MDITKVLFKSTVGGWKELEKHFKDLPEEILDLKNIKGVSTKFPEISSQSWNTYKIDIQKLGNNIDVSMNFGAPTSFKVSKDYIEARVKYDNKEYIITINQNR